jgi:hypothetical protein
MGASLQNRRADDNEQFAAELIAALHNSFRDTGRDTMYG